MQPIKVDHALHACKYFMQSYLLLRVYHIYLKPVNNSVINSLQLFY